MVGLSSHDRVARGHKAHVSLRHGIDDLEYRAQTLAGLRASEVMGLKWCDLDWDNLTIFVIRSVAAGRIDETKTEASAKPLPLDPELATALLGWRRQAFYTADSDFVFAGDSGRPRWQGMILKGHIQPAAIRAGIGRIGWHTLRHSYRAWLSGSPHPQRFRRN
jgi:integrase